jgi:3-keto-L-gulonate-6-phosphate decarboxylase
MKLQVAIDLFSVEDTLRLLRRVWEYVDIIEAGPP